MLKLPYVIIVINNHQYYCGDCKNYLCADCNVDIHQRGIKSQHERIGVKRRQPHVDNHAKDPKCDDCREDNFQYYCCDSE